MRHPILAVTLGLAMTLFDPAPAPAESLPDLIQAAPRAHPRLFLPAGEEKALPTKMASDPLLQAASEHVLKTADAMLRLEPVKREMVGRRLLGTSRTCLKRVTCLAFAHRLSGDIKYVRRAEEEMRAAAAFTDWNPNHFLDVGEMCAALGLGYDWLYEKLDPEAREIIRDAIIEKGLKTSLKGGWWVSTENNWNPVCHGGLTIGALAVLEDEPELAAQIIERAVTQLPRAMAEYAPDGAYPEGPGYWAYGTTYTVLLIAALESVLGTDFALTAAKGFLESSDYYRNVTGPTGLFFNYSDCGTRGSVSPAMYWFAAKRRKPALLWQERRNLASLLKQNPRGTGDSDRLFPFLLLWAPPLSEDPSPATRHWKAEGKTPVGIHRSGWKDAEETFVAVKGGSPGTNHAHMDIGTFVMDAKGVRWAEDLGMQSYNSLESRGISLWNKGQDSQRWKVFRLNNFSHNTLVVDGEKQRVDGHAPITAFTGEGTLPHTVIDMTSVYAGQLAESRRGIGLRDDQSVVVQDEIRTLDRETSVRWGMVTRADVEITSAGTALLQRDEKQFTLQVLSPATARLEIYGTENPPQDYDASNPGTRMVGFTVKVPASTAARLVVVLSPEPMPDLSRAITPLASWGP